MTIWTTRTLLYKLWDKTSQSVTCRRIWRLFLYPGTSRRNGGLYGIFRIRYHHFADPCYRAGRGPRRLGRCQSAGGLRLGQPRFQCSCAAKYQKENFVRLTASLAIPKTLKKAPQAIRSCGAYIKVSHLRHIRFSGFIQIGAWDDGGVGVFSRGAALVRNAL